MIGKRSGQGGLFRADHMHLDHVGKASFYGLLSRHGYEWFRDETFEDLYRSGIGRPSTPPSQLCITLLLQTHDGVSDDEAIQRTAYDLRWKVALGLEMDEKLCAKSTLQLFRAKLILHEQYEDVFEKSVEACRKAGLFKRRRLEVAIDTTPILGRGAVKDTYNLVSDQIQNVVKEACKLKGWTCESVISEHRLARYFGKSFKGSVELDWSQPAEKRALLAQLVADARVILELAKKAVRGFARNTERTRVLREAEALLTDLLLQDIDENPTDESGPEIRKGTKRDRIISTTDPEMRHGRKSNSKTFNGYKASIVVATEAPVILSAGVLAGNASDNTGAVDLVQQAVVRDGRPLERVIGDTAYGGLETRQEFESHGLEVIAKAPPGARRGFFGLKDFHIDTRRQVARCPNGKTSSGLRTVPGGHCYVFSRQNCEPCSLRSRCTTSKNYRRSIQVTEQTKALERLRKKQRTKSFKEIYRRRVIVEHRIARLIQLGMRQARCFGKVKIRFQLVMAATVANLGAAGASLLSIFAASFPVWRPMPHISRSESVKGWPAAIPLEA